MPKHHGDEAKRERDSVDAESTLSEAFDVTGGAPLLEGSWSFQDGRRGTRRRIPSHWRWILSTFVFAAISICLVAKDGERSYHRRMYETGFDTDLDSAYSAIHIKKVRFTGGLHYDENGTVVRNPLPGGGPEWVGPPNPATDKLWDDLGDIAGVGLVGHEADMVRGKTKQLHSGEYITGLDVFHQLHCLNKVRKALYPDYYRDPDGHEISALHTDHCLDYIRQSIMCAGDMTPAHVVYSAARGRWSPDFENEHTCRDLSALVDWTRARQPPESDEGKVHH